MFRIESKTYGSAFNVRVIQQGDTYGFGDRITHKNERPLIEFHILDAPDSYVIVARYRLDKITSLGEDAHLTMDQQGLEWTLDPNAIDDALSYATCIIYGCPTEAHRKGCEIAAAIVPHYAQQEA